MPKTDVRSEQIRDGSGVKRADLDVTTSGSAVIVKLIAGTGISLESTGPDAGTGDVTISVSGGGDPRLVDLKLLGTTQTRASTTTLSDCAGLISTALATHTRYLVEVGLMVLGASSGGQLKFGWRYQSGTTLRYGATSQDFSGAISTWQHSAQGSGPFTGLPGIETTVFHAATVGTTDPTHVQGLILIASVLTGDAIGDFGVQVAQYSSSATATSILAGSWMKIMKA